IYAITVWENMMLRNAQTDNKD
ncbi:MAG: NUDIX hydrolase, partial [Lactobacillus crispatus]|nr:NUDIX hydrolase [Lactobacillus crispatus]MCT7879025.1 NUDIX hydrolase [Lactobacillus crispatus]